MTSIPQMSMTPCALWLNNEHHSTSSIAEVLRQMASCLDQHGNQAITLTTLSVSLHVDSMGVEPSACQATVDLLAGLVGSPASEKKTGTITYYQASRERWQGISLDIWTILDAGSDGYNNDVAV